MGASFMKNTTCEKYLGVSKIDRSLNLDDYATFPCKKPSGKLSVVARVILSVEIQFSF